ncbi:MAG: hypothetical protein E7246_00785 [Lachnoclostridium sp.]|nr:hypothetical protein [Lachnoclostridium sp.]
MRKKWNRVLPMALAMSLACTPVLTYAKEFVSEPGKPYDDETQKRLEDNVMEYEEISRLIDVYNTTLQNLRETYKDTKDSMSDIEELKEQIEDGSDQLADTAEQLQATAETFKGMLGLESPMLPAGMSVSPSAYAEMVYSAVLLGNQSEQILLSADQLTEMTPEMMRIQIIDTPRAAMIAGAQSALIGYEQILLQKGSLNSTLELLQAVYQSTERQAAAGMATQNDVISAKQNLDSVQAGLMTIEANEVKIRQTLCTMLGWAYNASPEIPEIPEVDPAKLEAMNLEADTQKALENNFTLKYNRLSKGTLTNGSVEMQNLIRTIDAEESEIKASMVNLYYAVTQAKNELSHAQNALTLEQSKMDQAERKMALGMIGRLEYLQQKNAFATAEVNVRTAELALLQAVETYDWAVQGNLTLSQ